MGPPAPPIKESGSLVHLDGWQPGRFGCCDKRLSNVGLLNTIDCGPVDKSLGQVQAWHALAQSVAERRPYRNVGMDHGSRFHRIHGACRTDGPCAPSIHKGVGVGCGNRRTHRPVGPLFAGNFPDEASDA